MLLNPPVAFATAHRVLTQLRHDPRSLALMIVVPCVLQALLAWVFDDKTTFDRVGPSLLGTFPLIVMFLITAVTTLRERRSGTLERLLAMPAAKLDLLAGYALAFGAVAVVQAVVVTSVSVWGLGMKTAGPVWLLGVVAVLDGVLGTALGLFVSAFAATEFQAVQFMPAFVFPQFLLGGLLVPRDQMNGVLRAVSDALPVSYAIDGMQRVAAEAHPAGLYWRDIGVLTGCILLALLLGAATLRRRTP
ncbi:antibiotic ABC transporter permease [Mangrovactinospora gilvigrisea]|uniref:Transport permease protein n=1 Tax=Mangrovactinospora gilvigrisea TaxID=1428644 RepID=A0A1J7BF29_9ACTN|nr:ABC transporter permease [Mangrovactinospora gilvigrisea]OIV37291.1 antibiotic ABC transporter permease [Mangrovactinospora gilvigrisea]